MADDTHQGLASGDRSQGYEVVSAARIAGLDNAYSGKDTRDRDATVTLLLLCEDQDQSALFDTSATYERVQQKALVGLRTVVRFGGGSAAVIGKEQGAPLDGETLATWLKRRGTLRLADVATLFMPVLKALTGLHAQGLAHGSISAGQMLVRRDGSLNLLGPWRSEGGEADDQFILGQAPELVSGDAPRPVSDVYSIVTLLYWALSGTPAPAARDRLASKAQHDEDPLQPILNLVPGLDDTIAQAIETGLRLHPATRPQSMDGLIEVLEPHAGAKPGSSSPPPLPAGTPTSSRKTPWWPKDAAPSPPPLPSSQRRSGGVPPVPKSTPKRTSTIGQAPPELRKSTPANKPKSKMRVGTILSFIIALGVAWVVASGGMFGDQDQSVETTPSRQTDNQRDTSQPQTIEVENQPRKGPRPGSDGEVDDDAFEEIDDVSDAPDGVTQQFCTSRFTYNSVRDAGTNALRAYLSRCNGIQSEFVDAARRELGE
jgi:hypothetical protein